MKKVICIIFIYTLLLLSGTDLSADQKFLDNGYGHTGAPPGTNAPEPISSALVALGGVGLALYEKFKNN